MYSPEFPRMTCLSSKIRTQVLVKSANCYTVQSSYGENNCIQCVLWITQYKNHASKTDELFKIPSLFLQNFQGLIEPGSPVISQKFRRRYSDGVRDPYIWHKCRATQLSEESNTKKYRQIFISRMRDPSVQVAQNF